MDLLLPNSIQILLHRRSTDDLIVVGDWLLENGVSEGEFLLPFHPKNIPEYATWYRAHHWAEILAAQRTIGGGLHAIQLAHLTYKERRHVLLAKLITAIEPHTIVTHNE